eukprot:g38743.t1
MVSWSKRSLQKANKGEKGNKWCGIPLEVVEMAANDSLDVDAGGMVDEDKRDSIDVVGAEVWVMGRYCAGVGSIPAEGPVSYSAGESSLEEKGDPIVKVGITRTMRWRRRNRENGIESLQEGG